MRLPYRFVSAGTGCGFIFIPLPKEFLDSRRTALENFTVGAKYDQRLTKQIGVVAAKDGEHVLIDWMYIEGDWTYDAEIEGHLKNASPLRPLKERRLERYRVFKPEDDAE